MLVNWWRSRIGASRNRLVAEAAGNDEQLEVESEALFEHAGEDGGQDVPSHELDARLGVLDVQAETEPYHLLVAPRVHPPQEGVLDL